MQTGPPSLLGGRHPLDYLSRPSSLNVLLLLIISLIPSQPHSTLSIHSICSSPPLLPSSSLPLLWPPLPSGLTTTTTMTRTCSTLAYSSSRRPTSPTLRLTRCERLSRIASLLSQLVETDSRFLRRSVSTTTRLSFLASLTDTVLSSSASTSMRSSSAGTLPPTSRATTRPPQRRPPTSCVAVLPIQLTCLMALVADLLVFGSLQHEAVYGRAGPPRLAFPNPTSDAPLDEFGRRTSFGCMKGPFTTGLLANGGTAISSDPSPSSKHH